MRNYLCKNPVAGLVKAREDAMKDGIRCIIISNNKVPFCSATNLSELPACYLGSTLLSHALGLTDAGEISIIKDALLHAQLNSVPLLDKRDLLNVLRLLKAESEAAQPDNYIIALRANRLMEKIMKSDNLILGGGVDFLSRLILGVGSWSRVNLGHKKLEARQVLFAMLVHAINQTAAKGRCEMRLIIDETVCDFKTLVNGKSAVSLKLLDALGKAWTKGVDICLVSDCPHEDMDNIVFDEKPHLQSHRYAFLAYLMLGTFGWGIFGGVKALFT